MGKAGRPSKLDDRQWAEAARKLAAGESYAKVAKDMKVAKSTLVGRFSDRMETIKDVAERLATAESDFDRMPITDRISVRTLADHLKGLTNQLVETARIQGETARIMAKHGLRAAQEIQPGSTAEDMRTVAACTELANKAGQMGMGLLTAGKGLKEPGRDDAAPVSLNILPVKPNG